MLRASCDRCHRDKLRCSFDQNSSICVRCQQRKATCVRSPPRPLGRTKGSKNKTTPLPARTTNPEPVNLGMLVSEDSVNPLWESSMTDFESMNILAMNGDEYQPSFSEDGSIVCMDSLPYTLSLHDENHVPNTSSTASESELSQSSSAVTCNCDIQMTRLLESKTLPCLSSTVAEFDSILNTNKSMLQLLNQLLACQNPHPSSFLMTGYLLMQGVLTSSHEAWWSWCRREKTYAVENGGQTVYVGSCRMNDEDARVLRRQMVMLDVEKVERLRDQFQKRIQACYQWNSVYAFVDKAVAAEMERMIAKLSEGTVPASMDFRPGTNST